MSSGCGPLGGRENGKETSPPMNDDTQPTRSPKSKDRILSAYAEDLGLCPWMNADSVAYSFLCPRVNATADSATGRGYYTKRVTFVNGDRRVL
jgi:hypothetical protein